MTIEFLQSKEQRNIKDKLKQSIKECNSLKAAVAFWNLKIDYFEQLAYKLSLDDSFVCVDIHQPTDIDCLKEFVEKNSNIYLFLYRSSTEKQQPLLHTKLLLFNLPDGKAEIWIGSQNFTNSALEGFNFEATSIITTTKDSKLYKDVLSYLNSIKACCEDIGKKTFGDKTGKFNIDCVDFYKKLQGLFEGTTKKAMTVLCKDAKNLSGKKILFLSYNNVNDASNFLTNVKPSERKFILWVADGINKSFIFYNCVFTTEGFDKVDTTFLENIEGYILRGKNTIPLCLTLSEAKELSSPKDAMNLFVRKEITFFITMDIKDEIQDLQIFDKKQDLWKNSNDGSICNFTEKTNNIIQIPKPEDEIQPRGKKYSDYLFNTKSIEREPIEQYKKIIEKLEKYYTKLIKFLREGKDIPKPEKEEGQASLMTEVRISEKPKDKD